jgi:hypothetical protein
VQCIGLCLDRVFVNKGSINVGNFMTAEQLSAFQGILCNMEFVIYGHCCYILLL